RHGQVRAELQCALQRSDGRAVIVLFHVRSAQIQESIGELWVDLGGLAEFGDFRFHLVLLACFKAGLQVLQRVRRSTLTGQPKKKQPSHHERSGSATSRNWSAATSFNSCFAPEGQTTSTVALLAGPRPKCRRLSLAQR